MTVALASFKKMFERPEQSIMFGTYLIALAPFKKFVNSKKNSSYVCGFYMLPLKSVSLLELGSRVSLTAGKFDCFKVNAEIYEIISTHKSLNWLKIT